MTVRAITGLGIVSALGVGRDAFHASLRSGTAPRDTETITAFDASELGGARPRVLEIADFDASRYLGDKGVRTLDRQTKLLVVAARLCLEDGGLKKAGAFLRLSPERVGIATSNAYGSLETIADLDRVAVLEHPRYINPARFPNTVANSASGYVSIWENLRALNVALSDGHCGALDALICADVYLETGAADAILVGGVEALSAGLVVAFERLGVLTARTCLGEGAALFVLEPLDEALRHETKVVARLLGTGTSFGPSPSPGSLLHASEGAMTHAVTNALSEAGILASDVDLVVSGVSRTGAFADAERGAITSVLGDGIAVAAPKSLFGETLGASGALGMAAALGWMQGIPVSTLIHGTPPAEVRTTVVTALGLYGNATAAILQEG